MAPKSIERSCHRYRDIWSSKNAVRPEQVSISNGKKYWFDCPDCLHEYEHAPCSKTNKANGQGCPYSSGYKICGNSDCIFCLTRSCYVYREIWSPKNNLLPEEVSISSDKKHWFKCKDCSVDYKQKPNNKTSNKTGCPKTWILCFAYLST